MREEARSRKLLFILLLCGYAVVFPLAWIVGLDVNIGSFGWLCAGTAIVGFGLITLCRWRNIPRLATLVEVNACGLLLTVPVLISTYVAFRLDYPMADNLLYSMDMVFGLDWTAAVRFIDARPILANAFNFAYASFSIQLMLLPLALVLTGRAARAYQMVSIYGVLCFISSFISIWFPAAGTYIMHGLDPHTLKHLDGYLGVEFLDQFNAVREKSDFVFVLQNAAGIVTFPSVHAAIAVLSAWAAWDFKIGRYPILILSILTAMSAAVVANHYVVDIIAGAGIACFSISLVLFMTRSNLQRAETSEDISLGPGLAEVGSPHRRHPASDRSSAECP